MNLVVTVEEHFLRRSDGTVWTSGPMTYSFWRRYLGVFNSVRVLARSKDVGESDVSSAHRQADGTDVSFVPLPEYRGPTQYLHVRKQFQQITRSAVGRNDAVLLRVGCSQLAADVESMLTHREQPFGVEVISDPQQILSPGAVRHPLRSVFREMYARQLRRQCHHAVAAAYVTEGALQRQYPAGHSTFATSFSDVELPEAAFVTEPRRWKAPPSPLNIVSIGSMAQPYKGFDVLIDAISICRQQGQDIRLTIVGDGRYRNELELQVARLGLGDHVWFVGQLPAGNAVRAVLDQADLFVLASRTEGLPRVTIEAMARGLPCIGTRVGGIPELLDDQDLVHADNAPALAEKIRTVATSPALLTERAQRNLHYAQVFRSELLQQRREEFLRRLRLGTEAALPAKKRERRDYHHVQRHSGVLRLVRGWK